MSRPPAATDVTRVATARARIANVRRRLLDTAAFGKSLTPDQLEHLAAELGETLRVLTDD
ncbi:hypothetical protein DFR70_1206 [Nocardia tenerifensis]|uniref:Uncharacterized protein n=1 Tax=Nocardia tenerifensis TaxID=228006 RepID=A0A318JUP5_9NOCA|nr:DUF6374 family protein [Nocardia tenerifensis]PXX56265.1 hypothetical protein DFR70_1206 [Nocardia tenerifensis]